VHGAAVEARYGAQRWPDHRGDRGAENAYLQRDARAVDDAGHDVVANLVHSERMGARRAERAAEFVGEVEVLHVGPREPEDFHHQWRREGDEDQKGDEHERGHCDTIAAKAPPEQLKRRARGDLTLCLEASRPSGGGGNGFSGAHAHRATLPRGCAATGGSDMFTATYLRS